MDYSSGGGGLSYNNFHLALQLSSEQLGWLDANQWFKYVLFKPYYQLTQDWEVYGIRNEYIAKLEYLMNHTETCQEITNYLEENNYVESAQEFAVELMDLEINGNLLSFFPSFKYPINSNYSTLYPNFTILVKEYIPLLKNDQRLLNTINRLTGVSISTIKNDLTWGNGPEINITQLGLDPSGNPYYGKFNILEPNKIYIDIDLVQQIEVLSNIPNPTPQQNQQIGFLNALITFSVCLHEYVHYSDFAFDGTMQDNENLELGLLFEEIYLGGYYEFNPNGNVIFIKAN